MTSIHVMIGKLLDDLECPDLPSYYDARVERKLIDSLETGALTPEEFHYYCERFRRLAGRRVRSAA